QGSQGYYNAVLAHFGATEYMIGYHPPRLADCKVKHTHRPPIWISVVGDGGSLIPVHCYTDYGPAGDPPGEERASEDSLRHLRMFQTRSPSGNLDRTWKELMKIGDLRELDWDMTLADLTEMEAVCALGEREAEALHKLDPTGALSGLTLNDIEVLQRADSK